jgi:hypothetical protein
MRLSADRLSRSFRSSFAAFQPYVLLFCPAISGRVNQEPV